MTINVINHSPAEMNAMRQRRQDLLRDSQGTIRVIDPLYRYNTEGKIAIIVGSILVVLGVALFAAGIGLGITSHYAWVTAAVIGPLIVLPSIFCVIAGVASFYFPRPDPDSIIRNLPAFVARVIQAEQNRHIVMRSRPLLWGSETWSVQENVASNHNLNERCFRIESLSKEEVIPLWIYGDELLEHYDSDGHRLSRLDNQDSFYTQGGMPRLLREAILRHPEFFEISEIIEPILRDGGAELTYVLRELERRPAKVATLSYDQYAHLFGQLRFNFAFSSNLYPAVWSAVCKDARFLYFLTELSVDHVQRYLNEVLPTLIPSLQEKFGERAGTELGKKIRLRLETRTLPNYNLGTASDPAFTFPNIRLKVKFRGETVLEASAHGLAKANARFEAVFTSNNVNEIRWIQRGAFDVDEIILEERGPLAVMALTFKEGSTLPRNLAEEELLALRRLANLWENKALHRYLEQFKEKSALPPADQKITFTFGDEEPLEVNALVCASHNRAIAHLMHDIHNTTSVPLRIPRHIAKIVLTFNPAERLPDDLTLHDYILLADAADFFDNALLRDKIVDHFAKQSFASFLEPLKEYNQALFDNYVPNIFERAWNRGRIDFYYHDY